MNYYVYSLCDSSSKTVRYIGCTANIPRRIKQHLHVSKAGSKKLVCQWIRELLSRDLELIATVLGVCDTLGAARAMERREIRARKNLLNVNGRGRSAPKAKEKEPEIVPVLGLRKNWWKEPEYQRRMMLLQHRK
jgi:hypothetical protein